MTLGGAGKQRKAADSLGSATLLAAENTGRVRWFGFWQQLFVLVILGLVVGLVSVTATASVYKNNLQTRVSSIAEALNSQRISSLRDEGGEAAKDDYQYLKGHLARVKDVNADAHFLYLMGRDSDGRVFFLVDSERVGSDGYSPYGETYPEATPELKAMFDNGTPMIEGPSQDSYGRWLSALAPIVDEQSYSMPAVIGMDIPADTYELLLVLAGGIPLLLTILIAAIIAIRHRSHRRKEENTRFRAEMISIASHELRTPLTGLRWSEEGMIKQKMSAKEMRESAEIMYDSTLRLQESIEDILQLASLESGRAKRLLLAPVDIRKMLADVAAMQRLPAEQRRQTLEFSAEWPDTLEVHCDAQRMKRVFNNLLSNAIKYGHPETAVTIGYGRSNDGDHIISIQDRGIGIPADEQAKVWSGFYRASNTAVHDANGTGMGLFLARSVIEQHGGTIWFESKVDKGTTIFVSLPSGIMNPDGELTTSAERGSTIAV